MSILAEVKINKEKPIVVGVGSFAGDRERIDYNAAIDAALAQRDPQADELDPETFSVAVKRHVPKDGRNTAIFGTIEFPDRDNDAAGGTEIRDKHDFDG
jgi:hypothetical protein